MTRFKPDRFVRLLSGVDSNIHSELRNKKKRFFSCLLKLYDLKALHGLGLTLCITKILTFLRVKVILEITTKTTPTGKYQTLKGSVRRLKINPVISFFFYTNTVVSIAHFFFCAPKVEMIALNVNKQNS